MSDLYTKREAAHLLGIDRNTLAKWARECGITTAKDPRDKRPHLLSAEDLRVIRERYADRHTFGTSPAYQQRTISVSSADLEVRVAELEQQVAALQQHLAANLTGRGELPACVPPRRLAATTARESRTPARPPVPPHLMSFPTWAKAHHINVSTMKTWRERGYVPVERGQWLEDGVRIDTALTIEGRQVAHQLAGIPWPCEVCAAPVDNETPHIDAMM